MLCISETGFGKGLTDGFCEQSIRDTYNGSHPKRAKQAKKAKKRLKTMAGEHSRTIANAMLRELDRKMTDDQKSFYRKTTLNFTNVQ